MISLDVSKNSAKSENSSSPLSLGSSGDEPKISFSDLLKGIADKKDGKVIQNGSLVLALDDKDSKLGLKGDSKEVSTKDSLLSLLKNDAKDAKDALELNPKLTEALGSTLSVKDVKQLIIQAKQYLKKQITQSDAFKNSDIKELPKTLKGLATLANKLGIDVSKITIEKVQSEKLKSDVDDIETKTLTKDSKTDLDVKKIKNTKATNNLIDDNIQANNKELEKQQSKITKDIAQQPIFKAQTKSTELSTEQLVKAREVNNDKTNQTSQKNRSDETLRTLLSGSSDTVEKVKTNVNTGISTVTAKIIDPSANKTDITKSLESLLHSEPTSSESNTNSKLDGITAHKADSVEVKINEAKQMIKYLSQDVKKAIDDYKAPFTRVKVQLNPQKLGEVDLTVIQRGKNLVVNLTSNNAAINTLAMNANDLRAQLNNSGINNATLNFNNSSQGDQNPSGQQQNRQNEQKAHKEYNYFETDEQNEEILSSLEIVVPNYA